MLAKRRTVRVRSAFLFSILSELTGAVLTGIRRCRECLVLLVVRSRFHVKDGF